MECMLRPPVSGDEAQRTLEHTNDQPHLTAADETLTVQTARAKGTITINLGNHQHPQTNSSVFYLLFHAVPTPFHFSSILFVFRFSFRLRLQHTMPVGQKMPNFSLKVPCAFLDRDQLTSPTSCLHRKGSKSVTHR